MLPLLALVVVYLVSLSHYSAGKSLLITIFISVTAYIMYFLFNMIGVVVVTIPSMIISPRKARGKNHNKENEADELFKSLKETDNLLKSFKKVNSGAYEWKLPIYAIVASVLITIIFNLLHTSDFIRALYFITFALFAALAYLDKLVTHMGHRLIPSIIEVGIYLLIAISLFQVAS